MLVRVALYILGMRFDLTHMIVLHVDGIGSTNVAHLMCFCVFAWRLGGNGWALESLPNEDALEPGM